MQSAVPIPSAKAVATQFFDAYRNQDVSAMVDLFDPTGTVEYVPFNLKGPSSEAGAGAWNALIEAFPNLTNRILSVRQDETGHVAYADVFIGGTQIKEVFGVPSQGKTYDLRHMFIFEINDAGKIISVISFWDNADWYQQLGKTTLG
ncbi:MAG: ester cyclase [Cyanobacteria bacterium P01_D01_bin.6]